MALPQPQQLTLDNVRTALRSSGHKITSRTLKMWVARGLLPQHESVKGLGRGRGVRVLYPASILDRALAAARLMSQGIPENTIRQQLDTRDREFAVGLVHKYAHFHRILSPQAHSVWVQWFEGMVDRIMRWEMSDTQKEKRVRFVAANHLSEFRLMLDTIQYKLQQRGHLAAETKEVLDELKTEVEAAIEDLHPGLVNRFRLP